MQKESRTGERMQGKKVMSCQGASLWIEIFPTGILSTKDALDDGNAYDSAVEALRRRL